MPFYPALPRYEPQQSGVSALIGGVGAGQQIYNNALQSRRIQSALETEERQKAGLKEFGQTRDIESLWKYSPELAVDMQSKIQKMDEAKQASMLKQMTVGLDMADKYMPYIAATAKTNPGQAQELWNEMLGKAKDMGFNMPAGLEKLTPETFSGVQQMMMDMKSLPALIGAQSRIKAAEIAGQTRMGAAEASAAGRLKAAEIHADATKAAKEDKYTFSKFSADYDAAHPGASFDDKWNAYKQKEGKHYSMEEQNKVLMDKVMGVINGPPPNALRKDWEKASPEEKQAILKREMDVLRPAVFPESSKITAPKPTAGKAGFQGPGRYKGPDGKPVAIRTTEEYNKVFGK